MRLLANFKTLSLMAVAVAGVASRADADMFLTVPPGLNPGDTYRLVFVTSTARDATSSDISVYNSFVSGVAASSPDLSGLGATWTDIGSTASVNAIDNIGSSVSGVGIYRLDGSRVAGGTADFFTQDLIPIFFSETGDPIGPNGIFTGTKWWHGNGTGDPGHELGTWMPMATGGWTWAYLPGHFYAISSEITVSSVPEPGGLGLTVLGGAFLLLARRRKQQNHMATRTDRTPPAHH